MARNTLSKNRSVPENFLSKDFFANSEKKVYVYENEGFMTLHRWGKCSTFVMLVKQTYSLRRPV
jgi:hypothetical protein